MKKCTNCGSLHNSHFKCCESCRFQWRMEKPSKRLHAKKHADIIRQEIALLPFASNINTNIEKIMKHMDLLEKNL